MAAKRATRANGMTKAHKAALATGRNDSRVVRNYLEALVANKPKRGRKRTADSVRKRMEAVERSLASSDRVTALKLAQERLDLMAELESMEDGTGVADLEEAFVSVAANFGERQGISYFAWRQVGVQPDVLRRAGITRSA
jgi:hypothetical protein